MILALFASLLLAAQPVESTPPPTNGPAPGETGNGQHPSTEDQVEAAAEAIEESAEAAAEAAEAAAEAADEAAEEAAEAATESSEDAVEERVCRRRNFYDEYGRRRSRKVCTPR